MEWDIINKLNNLVNDSTIEELLEGGTNINDEMIGWNTFVTDPVLVGKDDGSPAACPYKIISNWCWLKNRSKYEDIT